jgi:phosphate transport system permease protein
LLKDKVVRATVGAGGVGVIVAILLIFIYLLYVVFPLLRSPEMHAEASYTVRTTGTPLYLALEEQAEIGTVVDSSGAVVFFDTHNGREIDRVALPLQGGKVVSIAAARPEAHIFAVGLADGRALVVELHFRVTYPNDKRVIVPEVRYPLGEDLIMVAPDGLPLRKLAVESRDNTTLAGWSGGDEIYLTRAVREESFLGDSVEVTFDRGEFVSTLSDIRRLILDPEQHDLYAIGENGDMTWVKVTDIEDPRLVEKISLLAGDASVVDARLLAGGISLLVLDDSGVASQWFAVRDETGARRFQRIRGFEPEPGASLITPEYSRRGFLLADSRGGVALYHAADHDRLLQAKLGDTPVELLAIAPRADALVALDRSGQMHFWRVHNPHPEVSWSSLWGKYWYEGYDEPAYIWQSSAANEEFEPKFSLVPLTFGTLKAAFYAMLFAIPLAIFGAIYTAYFMTPKMRRIVKPTVEIMEALPTVILGFLAGLWLAPFVELHLLGVFLLLVILPVSFLLAAYVWHHLPEPVTRLIPDGWEAAALVPVLLIATWIAFTVGPQLELAWFDGSFSAWIGQRLGIDFDQRNSLVVGIAMGFAVIPTIFSISEDAIFSVPQHLTNGSLALGATPWQTLIRVVLLTASPGIFSSIMMGVGRAVGETMIVLMATGNTPVMDMSIFQGMRTLSANIAVEMPESEVGSTHFRILFLAALVLFLVTFLFNTAAEVIRQRLRRKYSSL